MRRDELLRRLLLLSAAALACGPKGVDSATATATEGEAETDSDSDTDGAPVTLDVPGFVIVPEPQDDFIEGAPVGDVNGDGLDDIAVRTESERAYVVFGKADAEPVDLAELSASEGVTFHAAAGIHDVLAAGDVDGDGFADLLLLTEDLYYEPPPRVYVVFGGPSLGPRNLDALDPADGRLLYEIHWPGIFRTKGIGDVNGDGFDDIAVTEGICCALTIRVIDGGDDLQQVTEAELDEGVGGLTFATSYLAEIYAAGDINGDGFDDVVIEQIDTYHINYATAHVVFGADAPLQSLGYFDEPLTFDGFTITDDSKGEFSVVAGADVNGDGLADVILGDDWGGGDAYVVFGKADTTPVVLPEAIAEGAGLHIEARQDVASSATEPQLVPDRDGDGLTDITLVISADDYGDPPLDYAEVIHGLDGPGPVTTEDPRRLRINDWPAGEHLGRLGGWGMINGIGGPDLVISQHSTPDEPAAVYVYFEPGPG